MTIKNQHKISICIAVLNNETKIENCIKSIISQTYKNYELIIVDGGSTDSTISKIKKYSHNIQTFISEKDNGIYNAFNKLINLSNGDFICFLGSDDYFIDENSLINLVNSCHLDNYDFVSSQILLYDDKMIYKKNVGKEFIYFNLYKGMKFVHSSSLTKSNLLKNFFFNEDYKIAGDFDLMVRIGKKLRSFYYNKPTIYYYKNGCSRTQLALANYECYLSLRRSKDFGYFKAIYFIVSTKIKIIIKNLFNV